MRMVINEDDKGHHREEVRKVTEKTRVTVVFRRQEMEKKREGFTLT